MSIYDKAADKAKEQLDAISDTMCYAKWTQVSMHLTNGKTHSCYHPPTHDINVEELEKNPSALHNTAEKKERYHHTTTYASSIRYVSPFLIPLFQENTIYHIYLVQTLIL